jgi:hypothetical protein
MLYAAKCYWPGVTRADQQVVARAAVLGENGNACAADR